VTKISVTITVGCAMMRRETQLEQSIFHESREVMQGLASEILRKDWRGYQGRPSYLFRALIFVSSRFCRNLNSFSYHCVSKASNEETPERFFAPRSSFGAMRYMQVRTFIKEFACS